MVKSFEVCQLPVRCARFIVRKQWFITASDDMHIRVFNYNTMEKVRVSVVLFEREKSREEEPPHKRARTLCGGLPQHLNTRSFYMKLWNVFLTFMSLFRNLNQKKIKVLHVS